MDAVDAVSVVGRDAEREAFSGFPDLLEQGAAALVLEGAAGIGKTALWWCGVDVLSRSARVLTARPGGPESEAAYTALGDLLGPLAPELDRLPELQRGVLQQALRRPAAAGGAHVDHLDVALAAAALLRAATRDGPVILAIDDLHWLDRSTARVLGYALRRLRSEPVGVVASRRASGPVEPLTDGLPPDRVLVLELHAMTEAEVDRLIRIRRGVVLRRPVLAQVHATSRGNPLYALELARALDLGPDTPATGGPLPVTGTLLELVGRRVARLNAGTREALLVVAMASRPTVQLVERVLGHRAAPALRRGVDADVLELDHGLLRFTHPLLAAVCYAEADAARRRALHLRVAGVVDDVEERARHLSAGTALPDLVVAREIEVGALAADARGAPEAAAVLAEGALRLTPQGDPRETGRRAIAAADFFWEAGACVRSEAVLRTVLDELPSGPMRGQVLHRLAIAAAALRSWPESLGLLEEGLGHVGADEALRAALERDLAFGTMQAGDVRLAAPHVGALAKIASATGDAEMRADAAAMTLFQGVVRGDPPPRGGMVAAIRGLTSVPRRATGLPKRGFVARAVLAAALLKWDDEFAAARSVLERLRADLWDRQLMPVLFQLGELECWAGRMDRARRLAEQARETCRRSGLSASEPMWLHLDALTAARAGAVEDARAAAVEALETSLRTGEARHQMRAHAIAGFIDLSVGDAESAARHLEAARRLADDCGYSHPGIIRAAADEIEADLVLGRDSEARARVIDLELRSARARSRWGQAVGLRCRGMLEAATGHTDVALSALQESVRRHESLPDPIEHGRALLALGGLLRRTNQRASSRQVLTEAVALFAHCGASLWKEKADREIARLAGRSGSSGGLTPSERALCNLVAQGLPNREIARELSISVKTVEAHLTAVYRRLGLRSRTELASHLLAPAETPGR